MYHMYEVSAKQRTILRLMDFPNGNLPMLMLPPHMYVCIQVCTAVCVRKYVTGIH